MQITFFGAARTVTPSCYLLEHEGFTFLVDCGLGQGNDDKKSGSGLGFNAGDIDAVILTHAHIDHSGKLPLLAKKGYRGPVYATSATAELSGILLLDSASIQESEAEWKSRKNQREGRLPVEPLYNTDDARAALELFTAVPYKTPCELCEGLSFTFIDAGHLLGSCSVIITYSENGTERRLVFSGDIGNTAVPMLKDPETVTQADYVVMESTYGRRHHKRTGQTEREMLTERARQLAEITDRTFKRGGNVIIPAFAVGRAQEILYLYRMIMNDGLLDYEVPVFLDSPLSISATAIYSSVLREDYFDEEAKALIDQGINPILFPSFSAVREVAASKALNFRTEPCVIIASSGMCEAGRIRHHLKHNLWREECTVLFTGYQAEGTLGREILEGAEYVYLFNEEIAVNAEICTLEGTSGHADQEGLLAWAKAMDKPKQFFITHGDEEDALYFAALVEQETGAKAYAPCLKETFVLEEGLEESASEGQDAEEDRLSDELALLEETLKAVQQTVARLAAAADKTERGDIRRSEKLRNAITSFRKELSSLAEKWK